MPVYPCFCPARPQPLLNMGGTGILLIYKVSPVPLYPVASVHPNCFIYDNSLLSQLFLLRDVPTYLLSAPLPTELLR